MGAPGASHLDTWETCHPPAKPSPEAVDFFAPQCTRHFYETAPEAGNLPGLPPGFRCCTLRRVFRVDNRLLGPSGV